MTSLAVRRVLLAALEGLPARLAQAVAGERDETRAHYLMSDAAHDLLSALGHEVEAASAPLPVVGERFRRGAKPRDLLTVSQWADRHRWLRSGTNAPGRWSTALTPYLREIMDGLSEHSPVRSVVFIKSSGVGGTEALYNWLGYVMHHLANKDMLGYPETTVPTVAPPSGAWGVATAVGIGLAAGGVGVGIGLSSSHNKKASPSAPSPR